MLRVKLELLRPQPGVLPLTYMHPKENCMNFRTQKFNGTVIQTTEEWFVRKWNIFADSLGF